MTGNVRREIPFRLERSLLFVPAANWKMIEKAAAASTDAVCIDLEDSVAPSQKVASRANVVRAFVELPFGDRLRIFRMNALDTSYAYRDLIEIVEAAGDLIDLVMVPKVDSAEHLIFVDTLLTQIALHRGQRKLIGIEAQIETASGFVFLREIAQASPRLEALVFGPGDYSASMQMPSSGVGEFRSEAQIETASGFVFLREIAQASPRLEALVFGPGDYSASMQMPSSGVGEFDEWDHNYPGHRWHAAMHAIVAATRAM